MKKHPPPWTVEWYDGFIHIRDADGFWFDATASEEIAHLCSAAPDLLEACKVAESCLDFNKQKAWKVLRTAIKKAEGK